MREVCDISYTILAERVEKITLADRNAMWGIRAQQGEDDDPVDIPDLDAALLEFDERLGEPLDAASVANTPENLSKLLRAFGR